MAEPISSTATTGIFTSITTLTLLSGIDAISVLGASAGAALFVMTQDDLTLLRRALFFWISLTAGYLCAGVVTELLDSTLPNSIKTNPGVGALIAAALAVKLLRQLIKLTDDPKILIRLKKGNK